VNKKEIQLFGQVFNGKTPSKTEQRGEGLPILKIKDIDENGRFRGVFESFVDSNFYKKHSKKKLKAGDTIILNAAHNSDYVGSKNAFIHRELEGVIATGEWLIVRPDSAHPQYVNHFLKSPHGRQCLKKNVKGIHLYPKDVERIEIPFPFINDQIRIAHLLGKVEGLIAQRKQHLQQLDDLLKSVFLEMFGNPVRNEKGWEKPELKAFGKISTGNTPPRKDPSNYDGDFIEWIKTDNIPKDAMFITSAAEHLSETGSHKARMLKKGALLVACIAGSIESIGRAALTDRPVAFNQQINAIQPAKDVNPHYLYGLFKLSRAYIQSSAAKGMKKIITKGDFEKITFIKPPIELQNQFATIVEKVEALKSRYQQSLSDLESLYGALSQQAFKGELDLSQVPLPTVKASSEKNDKSAIPSEFGMAPPQEALEQLSRAGLDEYPISSPEGRKTLLRRLFEQFLSSLQREDNFNFDVFWNAPHMNTLDYMDDSAPFGLADYELLKEWVFEALNSGRLQQVQNMTGQDDKGEKILGNKIELKIGVQP